MNPLGYQYPAGAENDPDAPWNQSDDTGDDEKTSAYERACERADIAHDLARDEPDDRD